MAFAGFGDDSRVDLGGVGVFSIVFLGLFAGSELHVARHERFCGGLARGCEGRSVG